MAAIYQLSRLKTLNLSHCKLPNQGLEELASSIPRLQSLKAGISNRHKDQVSLKTRRSRPKHSLKFLENFKELKEFHFGKGDEILRGKFYLGRGC